MLRFGYATERRHADGRNGAIEQGTLRYRARGAGYLLNKEPAAAGFSENNKSANVENRVAQVGQAVTNEASSRRQVDFKHLPIHGLATAADEADSRLSRVRLV